MEEFLATIPRFEGTALILQYLTEQKNSSIFQLTDSSEQKNHSISERVLA